MVEDSDGPKEPCRMAVHIPCMGRGNFEEWEGPPIVKCRDTAVICTKTAEPIEITFGLWAQMGPRNYVLDEVHISMEGLIIMGKKGGAL